MTRFLVLFLLALSVGFYGAVDARAQDAATQAAEDEDVQSVRQRVQALIKPLDDPQRTHFYAIYDSHNLINVVKTVQGSVSQGVEKCVENNPDMKDALNARHKEWKNSINAVLKEAEGNVKNMIAVQDYTKPKDIRSILKFVDKTRKNKDKDVQKVPVTSPEACEYLLNKMDETEDNLTGLLRSTLVSLPQALQNAQDAEDNKAE